jgi:hypothetical protein
MMVSGPDSLDELARGNTLLNWQFSEIPTSAVVYELAADVGWNTILVNGAEGLVTARFDGANLLKACIETVKGQGVHLREGLVPRQLEVGVFGESSGVVLIGPTAMDDELLHNDNVALITRLNRVRKTNTVYNWLVPMGGGEGTAALTLAKSTRGTPYPIQTITGRDGKTLYYISDAASIVEYGEIRKVATFKQISPLSNNDNAMILAANALYDAAAAELSRNSMRQDVYSVSCRKMKRTIRPGDKITVRYKGRVYIDGVPVNPIDVNAEFWVLRVTERVAESGATLDLEISTVDKMQQSTESIIVGAIESISLRNLTPVMYPSTFVYPFAEFIQNLSAPGTSPDKYATILINFEKQVTDLTRVILRFTTENLYAPTYFSYLAGTLSGGFYLTKGTQFPRDIALWLNGVDITLDPDINGPFAPNNISVTIELDITQHLLDAVGGWRQEHTLELRAGYVVGTGSDIEIIGSSPFAGFQPVSHGIIRGNVIVEATCQANIST